jgi:hypothetical protein
MIYALCFVGVMVVLLGIGFISAQLGFRTHRGVSRNDFVRAFADDGIPPSIPAVVFDYYKSGVVWEDFSVAPDDTYDQALSEGDEEIDEDARTLVRRIGLELQEDRLPNRADRPIRTIRDMVLWLDSERRRQEA